MRATERPPFPAPHRGRCAPDRWPRRGWVLHWDERDALPASPTAPTVRALPTLRAVEAAWRGVRVRMTLYIQRGHPSSARAVMQVRALLAHYDPAQVELGVADISCVPRARLRAFGITEVPGLVCTEPGPRTCFPGELRDAAELEAFLAAAGVCRRVPRRSAPGVGVAR
ncbi:MAG: hypothetical protein AB2A00_18130 [Myxococcota bacterium]